MKFHHFETWTIGERGTHPSPQSFEWGGTSSLQQRWKEDKVEDLINGDIGGFGVICGEFGSALKETGI